MAEGDATIFKNFKLNLLQGDIDLASSMKVGLLTGYTPDQTDALWGDLSVSEVSGAGYSAGGGALASEAVALSGSNAKFDAANFTWNSLSLSGGQPNYAIVYKYNVSASLQLLVGYWQISTSTNGGDYTLQWSSTSGIVKLT